MSHCLLQRESKPPSNHSGLPSTPSRGRLPGFALLALLLIGASLAVSSQARASDQYEYDSAGRLFQVTHHTGRITTYTYDGNGNVLSVTVSLGISAVEEESSPLRFALGRAYPNPGRSTAFMFSLPNAAPVTVRLFSVTGRLVATILNGTFGPGTHRVELSRGRWAAGVYYYRLDTPGFSKVRKFVLLK